MTIRKVPGTYATIADAIAASAPGDTIAIAAGYAGPKTATVAVNNLTFSAPASVTGIVLTATSSISRISLAGDSPIAISGNAGSMTYVGNDGANVITGFGDSKYLGGGGNDTFVLKGGANAVEGGAGLDTVKLGTNGSLAESTFKSVEVLDVSSVWASIAQLSSFASITDSSGAANSRIQLVLTGAGGTLDLSSRVSGQHSVSVSSGHLSSGALKVVGTANDDQLRGTSEDDVLDGGAGNDYLDGWSGSDTLKGGAGDDLFRLNFGQSGIVDGGDGIDTIGDGSSGLDGFTISNVEILDTPQVTATVAQLAAFSTITDSFGTPNSHIILWLKGAGGTLDLSGRVAGAHSVLVQNGGLTAGVSLTGTVNADGMQGSAFDDILNGGLGADNLNGGAGNDTYVVDNAGDGVTEFADQGTDTVQASLSWTLSADVENLTLRGAANINGTGNELGNALIGNDGRNVLNGGLGADSMAGGLGNDTYVVDHAADVVTEAAGAGSDTVQASRSWTLSANVENLTLTGSAHINGTGNELKNTLIGNNGKNVLTGGAGADKMAGGLGNDTYVVDSAGDAVTEAAGAGTDTVRAAVSCKLSANVENLTLTGAANINGTGNDLNNRLIGNTGNNTLDGGLGADVLRGGAGNDRLIGGAGNDDLTGGAGNDSFLFNAALSPSSNVDDITDFNVANDTIELDNAIFAALTATGTLAGAAFHIGSAAHDATDRIVYDALSGGLFYDSNGNAAGGSVKFAELSTGLGLTFKDFLVV